MLEVKIEEPKVVVEEVVIQEEIKVEVQEEVKVEVQEEVKVVVEEEPKVEEPKVEEPKVVVEEVIPVTPEEVKVEEDTSKLHFLLELFMKTNGISNKCILISKETKHVIELIIKKFPNYLEDIENLIINIVKDDKIDSHDIPNIILLIEKLYEIIYNLKEVKITSSQCADTCKSIFYFIIYILVEERKIIISDDKKEEFLGDLEKLIDVCINLIKLPSLLKQSNCFKTIFGF